MSLKYLYLLVLPLFILVWYVACTPKIHQTEKNNKNSYQIKISPKFAYINDPMMPEKRPCIEGEVNGIKKLYCQGIEGFTYEEGYYYVLEITEEKLDPVPADYLADRIYKLVKIISKESVSSDIPKAQLTKISVETTFDNAKTNSSGYQYIFPMTPDGGGFTHRVARGIQLVKLRHKGVEKIPYDSMSKLAVNSLINNYPCSPKCAKAQLDGYFKCAEGYANRKMSIKNYKAKNFKAHMKFHRALDEALGLHFVETKNKTISFSQVAEMVSGHAFKIEGCDPKCTNAQLQNHYKSLSSNIGNERFELRAGYNTVQKNTTLYKVKVF